MSDFSHAVRGLRRSPALAAIAILSLALGIGANSSGFRVLIIGFINTQDA